MDGCKIVFSRFVCYVSVTFFAMYFSVTCHKPKRDLASLHILLALQNANQMYVISWTRQVWYWCWRELTRRRRQIQTSSLTYILGFMILYIKTNKMVYMLMLIIKKGMAGSNCKSRLHILCKYKRNIYDWGGTVNDFFWCKRLFVLNFTEIFKILTNQNFEFCSNTDWCILMNILPEWCDT